jgi:hypothetical protein
VRREPDNRLNDDERRADRDQRHVATPPDQHSCERERHDRRGSDPRAETGEPPPAVEDQHGEHRLCCELRQAAAEDRPPGRVGQVL